MMKNNRMISKFKNKIFKMIKLIKLKLKINQKKRNK